jgi:23S rRNA pseudouridine1911/1915/1917 synthase
MAALASAAWVRVAPRARARCAHGGGARARWATTAARAVAGVESSEGATTEKSTTRDAKATREQPEETLLRYLASASPAHFEPLLSDDDAARGVDASIAAWDELSSHDATSLTEIVTRASGLAAVAAAAAKGSPKQGGGEKRSRSRPDPATSSARGKAAGMFNVVLSALAMRGGDDAAATATSIALERMPARGVSPDVVSYSLTAAACVRAGDDARASEVIAAASKASGAGKRANSKKSKKASKRPGAGAAPLVVVYEDDHFAAVSKPAGILTHPTGAASVDKRSVTLVDLALDAFGDENVSALNGADARGIVHRLDKPTTGVMVIAKTDVAHALLVTAWYQRKVQKTYWAIVEGVPGRRRPKRRGDAEGEDAETEDHLFGVVDAPADGRPAKSDWKVLEIFNLPDATCSLVEVTPHTGQKHQVRSHMGAILGAPLVGDPLYRRGKPAATPAAAAAALTADGAKPGSVMFLHATSLRLEHPVTGEPMTLSAPVPDAFEELLGALRAAAK